MARGAGEGRLFEGGDYFKYFRQRGGGGVIEGRLLFEEIRYFVFLRIMLGHFTRM